MCACSRQQECQKRGRIETARAIYAQALAVFPGKKGIWRRAAQLEKAHGSREALDALLKKAVAYCPQVIERWEASLASSQGFMPELPDPVVRLLPR